MTAKIVAKTKCKPDDVSTTDVDIQSTTATTNLDLDQEHKTDNRSPTKSTKSDRLNKEIIEEDERNHDYTNAEQKRMFKVENPNRRFEMDLQNVS